MNVLVFAAHSDDEVIGVGGTIAKYAKEGHKVITVIFTRGDKSSPWLKKDYVIKEREQEAKKIDKFLGSKELILLGLSDAKLKKETQRPDVKKRLKAIIRKYRPSQIFVHSHFDFHPDHVAVNKIVLEVLAKIDVKKTISVFTYEINNVINETRPRMYVDISKTFSKKIKAMKMFKSQPHFIYPLLIPVYYKAIISGWHNKCKYAERFYKVC